MEKFQTFRRGKVALFCISFLFLLTFVFVACRKDFATPVSEPVAASKEKSISDVTAIQEAKQWFEKNYSIITVPTIKIEPLWKEALVFGSKIEVPYLLNGKTVRPSLKKNQAFGMQNLVFVKKGLYGYKVFSMGYAPNKDYQNQMSLINVANYRTNKFDGAIIVSNLDFRTLGSFIFQKGKRVNFVKLKKANQVQLRDEFCYYEMQFLGCTRICFTLTGIGGYYGEECFSECYWNETYTCYDDGNCSSCDDDCPGNPWCDDDCPGSPWCDGGGGGDGGCFDGNCDDNHFVPITAICASALSTALTEKGKIYGDFPNSTGQQMNGLPSGVTLMGNSLELCDLQATAYNLNIPLFTINIEGVASRIGTNSQTGKGIYIMAASNTTIANNLAASFPTPILNPGITFTSTPQSTAGQQFLQQWCNNFNNMFNNQSNGSTNGLRISYDLDQTTGGSGRGIEHGVPVLSQAGANCQ